MNHFEKAKRLLLGLVIIFSSLTIAAPIFAEEQADNTATMSFIRPADLMTIGQKVKLLVDKKEIAKLGHNKVVVFDTVKGKHKLQTKVGFSVGIPNVTGFNGAKKFKSKVNLDKDQHFYKIVFKAALMGGKHHIIEIEEAEYNELFAKI